MRIRADRIVAPCILVLACTAHGEPDPTNGYPNWHERGILVLTNACRLDPAGFRDAFIGSHTILLPANYPAVAPVYWHYDLNRGARAHSTDMANNCGLSHNSCNGTQWDTRIQTSYGNKSPKIGENIATSREEPLGTMRQWITDGSPPPTDKTSDGHRKNIMDSGFHEMGAGYAYGPVQYRHFWTQDLGGGTPQIAGNIVSGTHLFFDSATTSFITVYYDPANQPPSSATVTINGTGHAMSVRLGGAGRGTYGFDTPRAGTCRSYYFLFADGATQWRYPEQGFLMTYGEGGCSQYYSAEATSRACGRCARAPLLPQLHVAGPQLLTVVSREPVLVKIVDTAGKLRADVEMPGSNTGEESVVVLPRPLTPGVYLAQLRCRKGAITKARLTLVR